MVLETVLFKMDRIRDYFIVLERRTMDMEMHQKGNAW